MTETVAVIDYGMGNLHSVASALGKVCDQNVVVTSDAGQVRGADRVIFPGVGAIGDCMGEIHRLGFDQLLREQVSSGKPVLGICVGMQALLAHSEESGGTDCIDLFPGQVKFFGHDLKSASGAPLKVPHMGWNQVEQVDHPLWESIPQLARFYFVHSYFVENSGSEVKGRCQYGVEFAAALGRDNLFAVQFHPEKSHTAGLQLLQNFVRWNGQA
ncbi:imidazole glycerol phosphate synthase subunit HisH [Gilvimarinus sp. SDUM040013]|uniref:Imidazole glycerol phosphate synthase subunit HisH n=1 Tax=Gilvimarinus gilvus TaxID=3058038 RepID=A0ABU4RWK6_9GAMM|nr:imidazole glycerol phosphate synthase subunit HisH [Gilvimarinus sp. SDUM040013]MDO3388561.1 imidazole glycerol phosphate synthase subunit HisH [Gilvimarinus sp. SDUM040013]MDX6848567.1 imidazole glycerol phosphate synthase subunit HisH [Gilvimarinus sp. SDUM040013]